MGRQFLTPKEVAHIMRMSESNARVHWKDVGGITVGRCYRVSVAQFQEKTGLPMRDIEKALEVEA